jgi:hypothetical protein
VERRVSEILALGLVEKSKQRSIDQRNRFIRAQYVAAHRKILPAQYHAREGKMRSTQEREKLFLRQLLEPSGFLSVADGLSWWMWRITSG